MTTLNFDPKAIVARAIAAGLVQTPEQIKEKRKAESAAKAKERQLEWQRQNYAKRRIPKELHQKPGPKPKKPVKNPIGPMFRLSTASTLKKTK